MRWSCHYSARPWMDAWPRRWHSLLVLNLRFTWCCFPCLSSTLTKRPCSKPTFSALLFGVLGLDAFGIVSSTLTKRPCSKPVFDSSLFVVLVAECRESLGMQSGDVPDHAISASSSYDAESVGPQNGRWVLIHVLLQVLARAELRGMNLHRTRTDIHPHFWPLHFLLLLWPTLLFHWTLENNPNRFPAKFNLYCLKATHVFQRCKQKALKLSGTWPDCIFRNLKLERSFLAWKVLCKVHSAQWSQLNTPQRTSSFTFTMYNSWQIELLNWLLRPIFAERFQISRKTFNPEKYVFITA